MPCNSDHMKPTQREKELTKVFQLLDELTGKGKPDPQQFGRGYDERVYCKNVGKEEANAIIASLCSLLQTIPFDVLQRDYSLEMQTWWRDHKLHDEQRLRSELEAIKDEQEKQKALSKLTSHERSLLGL